MNKLILASLLFFAGAYAQVTTKSADVFEELESGNLTLRFYNAVKGTPIEGGEVSIESVGDLVTDEEGKVVFAPPVENGVLQVVFRADRFIPTEFPIEIMAGTLFFNRVSISPMMDIKFVRIVVDWDKEPRDLDAHFVKGGTNGYHISFRNMRVLADGSGMLDIDAMQGYGPETITVNSVATQSSYEYSVLDYTNQSNRNSKALSDSKATVKVYGDGKLLKVIQVPRKKEGNVWKVFKIEQGQVREINQLTNN
ncbi:MAG: YfaP family protein [Bacteroidota bacterium]